MLYTRYDLTDPTVFENFKLLQKDHIASWEHYYNVYNSTFSAIVQKGLTRNYAFNPAAHALMFILRHSLELNFKYNLDLAGHPAGISHTFTEIESQFPAPTVVPSELTQALQLFPYDKDGSCWRYYKAYDRTPYFTYADQIALAPLIQKLNAVQNSSSFVFRPVSAPFNYDKNTIKWDLTLHIGQCHNDWHIKGEYDEAISLLIDMVQNKEIELKQVYLPLLFMIRHAIELALKGNIAAIRPVSAAISQKDIRSEHSLSTLYTIFRNFLDTLDLSKLAANTQKQYHEYRSAYDRLNDSLHQLDSHSRAFRYPVDKTGTAHRMNLQKNQFDEILKLYQLTDPFLTFTTNVLIENNLLAFDPDVHG